MKKPIGLVRMISLKTKKKTVTLIEPTLVFTRKIKFQVINKFLE